MSPVYIYRFSVPPDAVDVNGHVNNVRYVQWMQDVAVHHFADAGGNPPMAEVGATWVARSHWIEYLRPAFEGDALALMTWVANLQRVRSQRRYKFVRVRDGAIIARGATEWVFVHAETGRPMSIPDTIIRCFHLLEGDADPDFPG